MIRKNGGWLGRESGGGERGHGKGDNGKREKKEA